MSVSIEQAIENAVAVHIADPQRAADLRRRLEGLLEEGNLFQCYDTLCYKDEYTHGISGVTCAITGIPIE